MVNKMAAAQHNAIPSLDVSGTELHDLERPRTQPEINRFRRDLLLRATLMVVAEKGIQNTTLARICQRAGVSGGLASHYFESKDALLVAAFTRMFEDLDAIYLAETEKEPSAEGKLRAIVRAAFSEPFLNSTIRAANLSFWSACQSDERLARINQAAYRRYRANLELLFATAAADRGVSIRADIAALELLGLIDGLWLGVALRTYRFAPGQACEICLRRIDMELGHSPALETPTEQPG